MWTHAGCSWGSSECILRDRQNLFFSFLPHAFTSRGKKKKWKIIRFDISHLPDMSTQHAQRYCPAKSLEYTAISHTSLSCHSAATLWGSLNRSLLSVPCQSSLPHSLGLPWIQCSWAARNTAEWQFCLTCHVWRWQIWQHPFFLPHLFTSCSTRPACIPQTCKLSLFLYTEVDVIIRCHHFLWGVLRFPGSKLQKHTRFVT